MKIFKRVIFVVLTVAFFGGCQKELNGDGEPSHGSLKNALTGDCNPITINGFYQEDSTLNSDNWVEVQVHTDFGGNFEIKSDTVNGFSFSRTGYLPVGDNTVRLLASGTPDTAINTTFTVRYDTSFCTFSINVLASTVGAAHYVLGGSPGGCTSFTPHGTYDVGTALDISDSVTFLVIVSIPGTYNISTPTVNGMKFSAVGSFTNSGINQVTLHGSGSPVSATATAFTVTGDGTNCTFSITPGSGVPPAVYVLGGNGANCTNVTPVGTYMASIPTNATNTVTVDVNVTTPGSYSLSTTTVNSVRFSKSGIFTVSGPQQVTLIANGGTPTASGPATYLITGASTTCSFSINYAPAPPPAVFTLSGGPGACAPATVNGTYEVGTALTSANTVDLEVTVTTPGVYTIATNTVGGMKFSATGVFSANGTFPVTLTATAASNPTTQGVNTFTPTGNSGSMCTFDINVSAAPFVSAWSFDAGATHYSGTCSGTLLGAVPDEMLISGSTGSGTGTFQLGLFNDSGPISTGNYSGSTMTGKYVIFTYFEGFPPTYQLTSAPGSGLTTLSAVITVLDSVNGIVQGTFSGTVRQFSNNAVVTITNGQFKANY